MTTESDEPELRPAARQILNERFANNALDSPASVVCRMRFPGSRRFLGLQTTGVLLLIIEAETPGYYQVFLDGRGHPKEPNPAWYGHSIGRWDGDTLVVETVGFNDRRWLTVYGTPISAKLHITERFTRPDLVHLQIETRIDDPETYPKPWTMKRVAELAPDEEIEQTVTAMPIHGCYAQYHLAPQHRKKSSLVKQPWIASSPRS